MGNLPRETGQVMSPIDYHTATPCEPRTDDTFIRTFTGRRFWPLDPEPEEVYIEDIAHALSLLCRFTGHSYGFYSVADHSLRVSKIAEKTALLEWTPDPSGSTAGRAAFAREMAFWGLLHDASEAYLCDMPSPLKRSPGLGQLYKGFEHALMETIIERFDLIPHEPAMVKAADRILLNTEMRDLMEVPAEQAAQWQCGTAALLDTIYPLDAWHAEQEFLRRFHSLDKARKAQRAAMNVAQLKVVNL